MLVVTRKPSESIVIQTEHGPVTVKYMGRGHRKIRLAIDAPRAVRIDRKEVAERRNEEGDGHETH